MSIACINFSKLLVRQIHLAVFFDSCKSFLITYNFLNDSKQSLRLLSFMTSLGNVLSVKRIPKKQRNEIVATVISKIFRAN